MNNPVFRMQELIGLIRAADKAYFGKDDPIMTDKEYDALVEELAALEKQTGLHFNNSPIGRVGGEVKAELTPVTHTKPMLSCNKTKDVDTLIDFIRQRVKICLRHFAVQHVESLPGGVVDIRYGHAVAVRQIFDCNLRRIAIIARHALRALRPG